jgi:hypothetical protein
LSKKEIEEKFKPFFLGTMYISRLIPSWVGSLKGVYNYQGSVGLVKVNIKVKNSFGLKRECCYFGRAQGGRVAPWWYYPSDRFIKNYAKGWVGSAFRLG